MGLLRKPKLRPPVESRPALGIQRFPEPQRLLPDADLQKGSLAPIQGTKAQAAPLLVPAREHADDAIRDEPPDCVGAVQACLSRQKLKQVGLAYHGCHDRSRLPVYGTRYGERACLVGENRSREPRNDEQSGDDEQGEADPDAARCSSTEREQGW